MPSKYLIDVILQLSKKGTGGKDLTTELKGVDTATKKLQASWKSFVGVGASVTAAAYAAKKAFEFGKEGAIITQTRDSFDGLLDKLGAAPDTLDQLRTAARGTVDDMTLMSSTSTLLAGTQGELSQRLAASTPQLLEIAKAANKLNPTLGDTTFLYQSLATGIKRSSPLILDNLGLTIKIGEANEALAAKLGKSVEELSAQEKQMALLEETLRAGNVLLEQAGGTTEAMGDSFAQAEADIKNATDQLKTQLAPIIIDLIPGIMELTSAFGDFVTLIGGRTPEHLAGLAQEGQQTGASLEQLAEGARKAKVELLFGDSAERSGFAIMDLRDSIKLAGDELIELGIKSGATAQEIQALADRIGVDLNLEDWNQYASALDDATAAAQLRVDAAAANVEAIEREIAAEQRLVEETGNAVAVLANERTKATLEAAQETERLAQIELDAIKSAEGLTFAHEDMKLGLSGVTTTVDDVEQAMAAFMQGQIDTRASTLGLTDAISAGVVALDEHGDAVDMVAQKEKEAEQAAEDLARAQEALADATEYARDAFAGFYNTLGSGIGDLRSLDEAQRRSAQDYADALRDLEAEAGASFAGIRGKYEDSLPDRTSVQERLGMAADAWDEWGLRLQDIMENGVASPWAAVLQQMGYEKPPDTGIKEWAAGLRDAFYAGDVQGLINEDAQAWRDHTATVQAAQSAETAAVQAGLADRRAALEAARQEELAAEKAARDEALLGLTLSLAEQTGQLERWATSQYGEDFAAGFDEAAEVLSGLESGLVSLDPALQNLLRNMATGVQATMDQTGATAAANEAALESLWETARAGPTAEELLGGEDLQALDMQSLIDPEGVEAAMGQVRAAVTENLPTEEDLQALDITRLVDPESISTATDALAGIGTAIEALAPAEDPFGFMGLFSGAAETIIGDSALMAAEVGGSFTDMGLTATGVAENILNEWTGNSVFPDLITGGASMESSITGNFSSIGSASGTMAAATVSALNRMKEASDSTHESLDQMVDKLKKGRYWAEKFRAKISELKNNIRELKKAVEELPSIPGGGGGNGGGGGGYQHGGQFIVRGPSGIDKVPVSFMATAGEVVTVTPVGKPAPKTPGYQHGGQFTVPGRTTAQVITVEGDRHNWYIQDQGSVALAMRLVENRRTDRLNEFMGG